MRFTGDGVSGDACGTIRNADEQPAVGAEIYIAMPDDPKEISRRHQIQARAMAGEHIPPEEWNVKDTTVKVYEEKWPDKTQTADANGKFTYADVREPWRLVARTPAGYAEISSEDFKKNKGEVILQPWGKVEGTLLVGTKPQPGEKLTLGRIGSQDDWIANKIQHSLPAITDKDGKFVFNAVAPGESWLYWEPKAKKQLRIVRHTMLDIDPGKTLTVDIGGKGRPVIGRAAQIPSNAPNEKLVWIDGHGQNASAMYYNTSGTQIPVPLTWPIMTEVQRKAWMKDWNKTPAGKEYQRCRWSEEFDINPDGTFRIDDLVPGKYAAQFRILRTENGFGEDLVECNAEFTVPPLPAGQNRTDEPLDIGTVQAKLSPRTKVGQPAPEFEVTTFEGKKIKLSDFKGKYVMLKWWWSWSQMDTEAPGMKKAYDAMMKQPDWVLINIGFDEKLETAKKRVTDYNLPGIQCHVPDYSRNFPKEYMGSPSTLCIIGPDGKVLARNMHVINADSEVAKIILEHR